MLLLRVQGRRKVWKSGGASSNAPPSWDRVNWSAKIWGYHGTPGTPRDNRSGVSYYVLLVYLVTYKHMAIYIWTFHFYDQNSTQINQL